MLASNDKKLYFLYIIPLVSCIFAFFYISPGYWYFDSYYTLSIFYSPIKSDWISPLAPYIWGVLYEMTSSVQSIFLFNVCVYFFSCFDIAKSISEKILSRICIYVLLVFHPMLLGHIIIVSKEATWLAFGSLTLALTLRFEANQRIKFLIMSIISLLITALIRWEAVVSLLPLFLFLIYQIKLSKMAKYVLVAVYLFSPLILQSTAHLEKDYPENQIFLLDLIKASLHKDKLMFELKKGKGLADLRKISKNNPNNIIAFQRAGVLEDKNQSYFKEWKDTVVGDIPLYLRGRVDIFLQLMRWSGKHRFFTLILKHEANSIDGLSLYVEKNVNLFSLVTEGYLYSKTAHLLLIPLPYLVFSFLLMCFTLFRQKMIISYLSLGLQISSLCSLLMFITLFFVATTDHLRFVALPVFLSFVPMVAVVYNYLSAQLSEIDWSEVD